MTTASPASTLKDDEIELIIEYLFGHTKAAIQPFLESHGLPKSGKKEELKARIGDALAEGTISADEIVALLDNIEGWGNQHVYLYSSPPGEQKLWKKESEAKKRLTNSAAEDLFNHRRPLVLPDEPTLSTVEWSKSHVRLVWVEKREWELRLNDEDVEKNGILYRAYKPQVSRGITTFDWNLLTGEAALMIQRLPTGEKYDDIRVAYEQQIEPLIKISNFTRVRARRSIRKLEKSKEALNRQLHDETFGGGKATFTSKGRKSDVNADKDLKKSRAALGTKTVSVMGNFYFLEKPSHLDRKIHLKVYSRDQRVAIFGECTEEEVMYVLSRIRQHSK